MVRNLRTLRERITLMLYLQIDKENSTINETIDYLHFIAEQVQKGFTSGPGWTLTGDAADDDESE